MRAGVVDSLDDLFDERILGVGAFVERLTRGKGCLADVGQPSLDDLLEAVAGHYGLQAYTVRTTIAP